MSSGAAAAITAQLFVERWRGRALTERAASQSHFKDLCALLGVPAPTDNRHDDADYCFDALTASAGSRIYADSRKSKRRKADDGPALFADADEPRATDRGSERSVSDAEPSDADLLTTRIVAAPEGSFGFADVWKRGCFCWEYKRANKHADLAAALRQLKEYKDSLDNPPLLIVSDIDRYEVHTNFTNHPVEVHRFTIDDLAEPSDEWRRRGESPLHLLQRAFRDPQSFRPRKTLQAVTEERAAQVGEMAQRLGAIKGNDPHTVAHFLMQMVFCLFAEDIGLLPRELVTNVLRNNYEKPERFADKARALFRSMAEGKPFGEHDIDHFNGGLFRDIDGQKFPTIPIGDIGKLAQIANDDWSAIEPSILGTLFERSLDPDQRSQIGAHYTSRDDILLVVDPVVMAPLRREFDEARKAAERALLKGRKPAARKALTEFAERLASVTILDPACGSGNFLYVALRQLLDLERDLRTLASRPDIGLTLPQRVRPTQLKGVELNEYAAELARVSIWIGYLKWQRENGVVDSRRPILDGLDTIEQRDAILDLSIPRTPKPAKWPRADFIIGNPPFLGSKVFRKSGLGDDYLAALYGAFDLPNTSDLCCYWFELARRAIETQPRVRAGLLATQGIRGGDNRTVLERIKKTGDIFMAWSDREWVLDGAAVHVSIVGFSTEATQHRMLDGVGVAEIGSDLTTNSDTRAAALHENAGLSFMGVTPSGKFEIEWHQAAVWLPMPNAAGVQNKAVLRPWLNALDMVRRNDGHWIIDFGTDVDHKDAARFEAPFKHVQREVAPKRQSYRTGKRGYWCFERPRPEMRSALEGLPRFIATPLVAKHRPFAWLSAPSLVANLVIVFARSDDYFFGALHSAVHELWALRMGTQLEDRPRYTPTTCFETFPLPWAPGREPTKPKDAGHALWKAIGNAAAELDRLRENWLNPPEWLAPVEQQAEIRHRALLAEVPAEVRPLVRRSAVMALAAEDKRLKQRTLTNLYNERPEWLRNAHEALDRAVLAAYRAVDPEGGWDPDWARVYRPYGAGEITVKEASKRSKKPSARARVDSAAEREEKERAIAARAPVDEAILRKLLRLNHERAGVEEKPAPKKKAAKTGKKAGTKKAEPKAAKKKPGKKKARRGK